jgi:hypothetical protein
MKRRGMPQSDILASRHVNFGCASDAISREEWAFFGIPLTLLE